VVHRTRKALGQCTNEPVDRNPHAPLTVLRRSPVSALGSPNKQSVIRKPEARGPRIGRGTPRNDEERRQLLTTETAGQGPDLLQLRPQSRPFRSLRRTGRLATTKFTCGLTKWREEAGSGAREPTSSEASEGSALRRDDLEVLARHRERTRRAVHLVGE
jgi:hypothetical protein